MAKLDPKFIAQCLKLANVLDKFDYYKLLQVDPNASMGQIRKAYHKQSRTFHPDRYYSMVDEDFKESIYRISKRVTEAYVTLRDSEKRKFYDQQLGKKDDAATLRYTEESAQQQKKAKTEEIGTTEQGRRMYQQGLKEFKRKDFKGAERSFKMALAYESGNELFKKMADEAGSQIKTDYMIK